MTSIPDPFPRRSHRPLRVLQDAGGLAPDKPVYQHFYHPEPEIKMMDAIAKNWKVDGIILHRNRGCHGLSIGIAENRLGPPQEGEKFMTYEGNMGGEREFDEARTKRLIDLFITETLGLKKVSD